MLINTEYCSQVMQINLKCIISPYWHCWNGGNRILSQKKKCIKNIACVSLPIQRYLVMKYKLWYP